MDPKEEIRFCKRPFSGYYEKRRNINGFLVHGKWTDIGNPQAYREACRWMLEQMPVQNIRAPEYQGCKSNGPHRYRA